jgi:hypothetical protein
LVNCELSNSNMADSLLTWNEMKKSDKSDLKGTSAVALAMLIYHVI